jgi:hypothetical protein
MIMCLLPAEVLSYHRARIAALSSINLEAYRRDG